MSFTRGSHDFVTKKNGLKIAGAYFTQSLKAFKGPISKTKGVIILVKYATARRDRSGLYLVLVNLS